MNLNLGPDYPIVLLCFIIGVTVHEFGHAFMAVLCGDDTPKLQGRLTLNPLDHLDPLGTAFLAVTSFLGIGFFGWGRPVLVNTAHFRSPRWGMFWTAVMGPIMSLTLAVTCGLLARFDVFHLPEGSMFDRILLRAVDVNFVMFAFNLIPIAPLDGSKILSALLPIEQARSYDHFLATLGPIMFMIVILIGGYLTEPILTVACGVILGPGYARFPIQ